MENSFMLMRFKKLFYFVLCLLNFSSIKANESKWHSYIDFTVGERIYYLYYAALDVSKPSGNRALILGSGAGNEDIELLRKGWEVWSVDQSPRSEKVIKQRATNFREKSHFHLGDFSSFKMTDNYDLVISFFALPFGDRKDLDSLVKNISNHMQKGSVFTVTFFGEQQDFVKKKVAYGIKQKELEELLIVNNFKIHYLINRIYDKKDAFDNMVHWDIFDVIAIKQ